ncbi:hypothetical protein GLIP_3653 [Aliiglaciecola lipolytica E3]|uniref:Uncharacterized protein n=1 Tax=Aliiglaciecola lipolytica E3 TaxID=1127673 RepID=K6X6M3_9ALTE|nr:hypothetical protein GLIP_3653 [Aliiglaciecola lipolytica E3]
MQQVVYKDFVHFLATAVLKIKKLQQKQNAFCLHNFMSLKDQQNLVYS